VEFLTKSVGLGVPFDGRSRLVRSPKCQILRPFGRLKLVNRTGALQLLVRFRVCKWFVRLMSNLPVSVRGAGRGARPGRVCVSVCPSQCLDGVELVGTGCSCRVSTSARLGKHAADWLVGRVQCT
jgi:hypothetical protein